MKKTMLLTISFILFSVCAFSQISSEKLFKSFKQGERTNCASIAFIKASLEVYGFNNLFVINERNETATKVTLKDNTVVSINKEELILAENSAGFVIIDDTQENREIISQAVLIYAIMAKNKEKLEKHKTFTEALDELEYGAYAGDVYKYLGFKKGKQVIKHRRLTGGNLCGLIAWSPAHAVYACGGYMDYHGIKKPLWAKYSGRIQIVK